MKRHLVILTAVGLTLLLAACGPATPTPEATATPTLVAQVTEASSVPTEAFPTPNPNPQCTAAPISPDPNIQPATADDWSKGPAGAEITLIEYGDFQ